MPFSDVVADQQVCVVLPNYNHGHCIARALQALIDQDHPPCEIIVIDDASTDDSVATVRRFETSAVPIRLLVNERNVGVVSSLQRGLLAARARYVYFAAADDWVLPGFFSLAMSMFARHPGVGLFCGDAVLLDAETNSLYGYRPAVRPLYRSGCVSKNEARKLLRAADNFILTGSAIFRREAVLAAGGFDPGLQSFADGYVARKIALEQGFCYAPKVVAAWCVSRHSVSRQTAFGIHKAHSILETVPRRIAADPAFPSWYAARFERGWRFATLRLALEQEVPHPALIARMGIRTTTDRLAVRNILRLPGRRLRQLFALAWFWYRLHPYRLIDLVGTALSRGMQRSFGSLEP